MKLTNTHLTLLNCVSKALFHTQNDAVPDDAVYREALEQAVLPLIYDPAHGDKHWKSVCTAIVAKNMTVTFEHTELHELLRECHLPYVVLKGMASASYYPDPYMRTFGDVDFLVMEQDVKQAGKLVESVGFVPEEDTGGIHIGYHRNDSTWELHREVNGVPDGKKVVNEYLSDIIETAQPYGGDADGIMLPDGFHHGLVLLLHTASHLTSEGVGLRHLCDWAVFVDTFKYGKFSEQFEGPLKKCGLWRFAQLLTLVSVKYLGVTAQEWTGQAEETLLEGLMLDILTGGNFGHKDEDRYRQIKYISNRGDRTVERGNPVKQVLHTIRKKAELEGKTSGGVVLDYMKLVMRGKRRLDGRKTVEEAGKRKKMYAELKLFE